ncbi:hypothetical protein VNO78_23775 [Psophocarpus tetragonolobus]|uniref:Uncharacterized protein n=1 Tax=Psophocarpus tetragonolobus TaxID=3891 RepID=A0AAN9S5E7_PSOTE
MDYNAHGLKNFLVDFIISPNGPIKPPGEHAASLVARAARKGLVKPKAIAAVAPTWAGSLPIVFGRDSSMESRLFDHSRGVEGIRCGWKKQIDSVDSNTFRILWE